MGHILRDFCKKLQKSPENYFSIFLHVQNAMEVRHHFNREAYFRVSDASLVLRSSVMIAKVLNCALGYADMLKIKCRIFVDGGHAQKHPN